MAEMMLESVANYVKKIAEDHDVTPGRDDISRMAVAITGLADDIVELDDVEQLLVNLRRRGVLTKAEIIEIQGRYFSEQRHFRKIINA
ncbi:Uncharacterised protein [Cedecea davisae]|uniref:Uncharacterized protein n=1 Tax=Cedecea davisae DSM 4568 TaxID=566551 RepID=S3IJ28_9ENTR|nr:hypothetical protein [Cedecea davisae]EPF13863.1 hypothetical protein HMPREF0201_04056 [Cedecea davisae DSM 4568]SUX37651.1 Uncharacterised protein [Cedecea davisae]